MGLLSKISDKTSFTGAAVRDLAINVLNYAQSNDESSFVVTGVSAGCGKTTLAIGLARAMAVFGKRVLLVESSPGTSVLAARLGLGKCRGISEYLRGKPLEKLTEECGKNVFVLTDGRDEDQLFNKKKTEELFKKCKSDFDIVLLDSIDATSPAFHILPSMKTLLLVVDGDADGSESINSSLSLLEDRGASIAGLILNRKRQYIPQSLMQFLKLN